MFTRGSKGLGPSRADTLAGALIILLVSTFDEAEAREAREELNWNKKVVQT